MATEGSALSSVSFTIPDKVTISCAQTHKGDRMQRSNRFANLILVFFSVVGFIPRKPFDNKFEDRQVFWLALAWWRLPVLLTVARVMPQAGWLSLQQRVCSGLSPDSLFIIFPWIRNRNTHLSRAKIWIYFQVKKKITFCLFRRKNSCLTLNGNIGIIAGDYAYVRKKR